MARPTEDQLADQRILSIDMLPGLNAEHPPERLIQTMVCIAHSLTHALIYVGDCIRARQVENT
jgi:hypothetical protein